MTARWQEIIASGLIGFVGACIVQSLTMLWQERTQQKWLRRSLYRELATIYINLRNLLPHLNREDPIEHEPNPANLPEFVKADCFNAAKSSPLFWRLKDAVGIVQAHTTFGFWEFRLLSGCKDLRTDAGGTDSGVTRKQWPAAARNLDAPFPVSPSGGKPGREGSPHAAKSGRLPPQEGLRPPCASPRQPAPRAPGWACIHPISMEDRELYRRILGIESPWSVASVDLQLTPREVHIHLTHADLPSWPCAECGAPSKLYDHQPERRWRHLDTISFRLFRRTLIDLNAWTTQISAASCTA